MYLIAFDSALLPPNRHRECLSNAERIVTDASKSGSRNILSAKAGRKWAKGVSPLFPM